MSRESASDAVQLTDYLLLVRRQWVVIVAGVLLGAALAAGYLAVAPREYSAATSVLVTPPTSGTAATGRAAEINLDTEARLVTSTETVAEAAELLEASDDALDLADRVTVTVPPNTEILTIAFVAPSAEEARAGAEAFAAAYLQSRFDSAADALDAEYDALQERIDDIREQSDEVTALVAALPAGSAERARLDAQASSLNAQLASLGSQQNAIRSSAASPGRVVTQAELPSSPSSPDIVLTMLGGLVVGLLAGLASAALRHHTDDRIRTPRDLERRADVPTAAVWTTPLRDGEVAVVPPSSPDGRAVARLRNLVTTSLEHTPRKVLLVAGTHRGAGSVAANIAASLARAGEEVCLVCADPFGNTATSLLGATPATGLGSVLARERSVDEAARAVVDVPRLRVLGPGRDPERAEVLLQGRGARAVVDRLLESVSYVVVEAPATTEGVGAQTLATSAELAVLVVETDRTTARDVSDALGQFESMHRPLLGAVVVDYDGAPSSSKPTRPLVPSQEERAGHAVVGAGGTVRPSIPAPPGGRDAVRR